MKIIKNFFSTKSTFPTSPSKSLFYLTFFILAFLLATCSESTTSSPSVDPNISALKALIYTNAKGNFIASINSKPGVATNLYAKLLNLPEGVSATNYALKASSSLPPGLNINPTKGIISGTFANADEINNHKSTIIAVLNDDSATKLEYTLTFTLAAPTLPTLYYTNKKGTQIASVTAIWGEATNLRPVLINLPGETTATGYALKAGSSLPTGLSLHRNTGIISGNLNHASSLDNHKSTIEVTLSDGKKLEVKLTFTVPLAELSYKDADDSSVSTVTAVIGETITLTPSLDKAFSTVSASYKVKSGDLPSDLTINPTSGVISGTLNAAVDNVAVTIEATLNGVTKIEVKLTFTVPLAELSYKDPANSPVSTVTAVIGETINLTPSLDKAFNTVSASYKVKSGDLPSDLTINPTSGVISGTLNAVVDNVAVTIEATLNGVTKIEVELTFTVPLAELSYKNPANSPVSTVSTVTAVVGEKITLTPSLDKAFSTVSASYKVKSGSPVLPDGLNINADNGVISGTLNAEVDNVAVTIEATLNDVTKIEKMITFNVNAPTLDYTNFKKNEIIEVVAKAGVITNLSPKNIPTGAGITALYAFKGNTTASTNGLKINTTTGLISGVFDKSFTNNIVVELTLTINRVETVLEKAIPFEIEPAETPFSARNGHQVVAYKDEMYLIGGRDSARKDDVWKSTNGANWEEVTKNAAFSARTAHQVVVFNNEMYLIGGADSDSKNDVWKSSDGANWVEVTKDAAFSTRFNHQVVILGDKMYLIGGLTVDLKGDVWESSNGKDWTRLIEYAPFVSPPLGTFRFIHKHQVVVLNNTTMYLVGGSRGSVNPVNRVYSSTDGTTWSLVMTTGEVFSARLHHQVVVLNRTMYLTGGLETNHKNDVYKSSDGAAWEKLISDGNAPFSKRFSHQMVVLGGEMYLIGGYDGTNRFKDVWKSSNGKDWFLISK